MPKELNVPVKQVVAPPAMDRLANVAKFDTLQNEGRSSNSTPIINSVATNNNNKQEALNWLDDWIKRENLKQELLRRSPESLQMEKNLGLKPLTYMMTGKPSSQMEELRAGFDQGLNSLKQLAAGAGSYVGIPGAEDARKMHKERDAVISAYRARSNPNNIGLSPGDIANTAIAYSPNYINPASIGGALRPIVARGANAIWHAIRGYLPNKSLKDAAVAAGSSVIGEKSEDLVTKGKGLVGNTIGTAVEEAYNRLFK
jgi:hypothetical protein